MDKVAIRAAMEEAGLTRPRVIVVKLRKSGHVFNLEAGQADLRRTVRVEAHGADPIEAEADDVEAAINELTPQD